MTAAQLIRRGWCRGAVARDDNGFATTPRHPKAAEWCAIGALSKAYDDEDEYGAARQRLIAEVGNLAAWNDRVGQEAVASMMEGLGI